MPPVLVDSILVDGSGNPIVDGSGNPIIILAGTDPADCECCGEDIAGHCIQASFCDDPETIIYIFRGITETNAMPVAGEIFYVIVGAGNFCMTIIDVVPVSDPVDCNGGPDYFFAWAPLEGPFETCEECDATEFLEYTIDYYDTFTCDYIGTDTITVTAAEAWFVGDWIGFSSGPHMYHKAQILSYDGLSAVTPDSTTFGDTSC